MFRSSKSFGELKIFSIGNMKMKNFTKIAILSLALIGANASAQEGRIDYSNSGATWRDNQGNLSQETDYNGRVRGGDNNQYSDNNRQQSRSRNNWRDNNRNSRYDSNQHNGYYARGVWHYGAPNRNAYQQRGFALGYHPWQRGQRLGNYNNRFGQVDYRQHNLRAPPRGYRWVQDDRGDYLLAAIVGGFIAEVVLNSVH